MAPKFQIADYVVFAISIIASLSIGIYFSFSGHRPQTNKQYLTGDGRLHVIPVAISLVVSFVSTIGILGNPAEVYAYGTQYMWYLFAMVIGILAGTFLFVPLYYPLKVTTVFEYTRMRFHARYLEYFVVMLALLNMLLGSGMMIYAPCVAFQAVSGFPAWASVLICGATATVYTSLGGIKAVVWTDVFQAVVIILSLLAVAIKGTLEVGSVHEVWEINKQWNRVVVPDFRIDPTIRMTFWSVCVTNPLLWMMLIGSQSSVQRFVSLSSLRSAKLSTILTIPGFLFSGSLACVTGVTAFAYYAKKGCDPLSSGTISSPNQILPFFVMDVLRVPCLPGLFIACLFSASLSSISTAYSGLGAIVWRNILEPKYGHLPNKTQANITKLSTFIFGVLGILTAYLLMTLKGTLIQISYGVHGILGGPVFGVILVGAIIPNAGAVSTTVAAIIGLAVSGWIGVGTTLNKVRDPVLPGPVHNCSILDPGAATTMSSLNNSFTELVSTGIGNFDVSNGYNITNLTSLPDMERSRIPWFYSVSYFYFPIVGLLTVFVVSIMALPFPCLRPPIKTQKRFLFPCLRRYFGAPDDPDSLDQEPEEKPLDSKSEQMEIEETKQAEQMPAENDVWISRDDDKMAAGNGELAAEPNYPSKYTHQDYY